jgi:PEP-CTERM motif
MLKRSMVAALAMGFMATIATAEITLNYSPSTVDIADGTTEIAISLTTNPGMDLAIGGIGFAYEVNEDYGALSPSDFSWTPDIIGDPNQWFATSDLPAPEAVGFFPGAAVDVPDGVSVQFASFNITPNAEGSFVLTSNPVVADENAAPLDVKGGANPTIVVTPEPASLALLAIGAMAMIRRRR